MSSQPPVPQQQYQPTSPPPSQPPPPIPNHQFHDQHQQQPPYQHQQQYNNYPLNHPQPQPWQQQSHVITNPYGYPPPPEQQQQQQQQLQQQQIPANTYPPMQSAYLQSTQQQHGIFQTNPMDFQQPRQQQQYINGSNNAGFQYNVPQPNWNQNNMNAPGMNSFVGANSGSLYNNPNQNAVGRYSTTPSTGSANPYAISGHNNNHTVNVNHPPGGSAPATVGSMVGRGSIPTSTTTAMRRPPFVDPATNIVYDVNDPDYEGWLFKQSQWLKEWRKRYFILKGSKLFFCKHPTAGAPHGMMDLSICTTVKSADLKSGKFHSFEISTPDTCYLLHAETENEKDDWIGRVGKAIVRCSRTYYKGEGTNNSKATTNLHGNNNNNNNNSTSDHRHQEEDDDIYENDDPDSPYFND